MPKTDLAKSILIFSDGACSGNPGPGGWGAIIATPDGKIHELGAGLDATTNNQMELLAAIRALRFIEKQKKFKVLFYTDSTYVIRGITQWVWGWQKKGWLTAEGKEVLNKEYWQDLFSLVMDRGSEGKIDWRYSRGHVGTPGNERCDEIAVAFSKKQWVDLYDGPLLKYGIAIYDVPEDHSLPEIKPKEEKKAAYSYLSYIAGVVYRHKDWKSCEAKVKGRPGVKFKKAMSAADEIEVLKSWGLSSTTEIKD